MEADVRKALLTALRLLLDVQKRLIDLDLRTRALQAVLAQATGVDQKSAEGQLQKIVESLRSAEVDAANEEVSAMLDFLEMGKAPDGSDARDRALRPWHNSSSRITLSSPPLIRAERPWVTLTS